MCQCCGSFYNARQGTVSLLPCLGYYQYKCEIFIKIMICHDILIALFFLAFGAIYIASYETADLEYTSVLDPKIFGYIFLGISGYQFVQLFFVAFMAFPMVFKVIRYIVSGFFVIFFTYGMSIFIIQTAFGINIDIIFKLRDSARKEIIRLIVSIILFIYAWFNLLSTYLLIKSIEHEKTKHMVVRNMELEKQKEVVEEKEKEVEIQTKQVLVQENKPEDIEEGERRWQRTQIKDQQTGKSYNLVLAGLVDHSDHSQEEDQ